MPPHRVYVEPFLGAGAIFRHKRPAGLNIGVELDSGIVGRWALSSGLAAVATGAGSGGTAAPVFLAAPAIAGDRAPAALAASDEAGETGGGGSGGARRRRPLELAAAAVAGGSGDGAGGVGGSGDKRSSWELWRGDGIEFLHTYQFQGGELVYCDPPYMAETRSSGRLYACEMSDGAHRELLRVIKRLPCAVLISGYWSELYGRELAGWRSISFEAMTRGGMATEWLWMNFPAAVELHDYRYLGRDRRQREQLKRQKARWLARLARMPELQRGALLSAIRELQPPGGAVGSSGGHIMSINGFSGLAGPLDLAECLNLW